MVCNITFLRGRENRIVFVWFCMCVGIETKESKEDLWLGARLPIFKLGLLSSSSGVGLKVCLYPNHFQTMKGLISIISKNHLYSSFPLSSRF